MSNISLQVESSLSVTSPVNFPSITSVRDDNPVAVLQDSLTEPKTSRGRPLKAYSWQRLRTNSDASIDNYCTPRKKRDLEKSLSDTDIYYSPEDLAGQADSCITKEQGRKKKKKRNSPPYSPKDADTKEQPRMESKIDLILKNLEELNSKRESDKKEITDALHDLRKDLGKRISILENENAELKKLNAEFLEREKKRDMVIEKHEKEFRKHNGIIRGLSVDPSNCQEEVNKFFEGKFNTTNATSDAYCLNRKPDRILVKFNSAYTKQSIFQQKRRILNGTNIYIENDLTERQRLIAFRARSLAREVTKTGGLVKIGNNRITINGQLKIWNDEKQDFIASSGGTTLGREDNQPHPTFSSSPKLANGSPTYQKKNYQHLRKSGPTQH